jgi:hypothetical protein
VIERLVAALVRTTASAVLCGLVLLCLAPALRAQDAAADFERGAELYRSGEFAAADAAWRETLATVEEGPLRAQLEYNLGNVAYRRGDALQAVAWYTASLTRRPRHAGTLANLDLARAEAGLPPRDSGGLTSALVRSVGAFDAAEAGWMGLGGVLVLLVALAYEALVGGFSGRLAAFFGAFVALVLLGPLALHALRSDAPRAMVVVEGGLVGREDPRQDGARIADVAAGAVVVVEDRYLDWRRVRSDGQVLWVPEDGLFVLPSP